MGSNGSKTNFKEPERTPNEKNLSPSEITWKVLAGEYKILDALELKGQIGLRSSELEDDLKGAKGVATDLVVAEFFATYGPLYSFLRLVYTVFTESLEVYRTARNLNRTDLYFVFKGGNILRIIAQKFLMELPSYAGKSIEDFYDKFFKRSDNDFGIYLNPDLEDYDLIYAELSTLSYYLQKSIREIILEYPTAYFDYSRYNSEYKNEVISAWLPKFSDATGKKYVAIKVVNSGPDQTMRFAKNDLGENAREVSLAVLEDRKSPMKITHNDALEFYGAHNVIRKFNLTRTKLHFDLIDAGGNAERVPGELIDVSIGHRDDLSTKHFFEHSEQNVVNYTLKHVDTNIEIEFKSFSLEYLTYDLEGILFVSVELPWMDSKYNKRLYRLMYMYFIDLFIKLNNSRKRMEVLKEFKLTMNLIKNTTKNRRGDLEKPLTNLLERYKDLNISRFLIRIWPLIQASTNNIQETNNFDMALKFSDYDEEQLIAMILIVIENLDYLEGVLTKVKEYCAPDGLASESDIYGGNFRNFI